MADGVDSLEPRIVERAKVARHDADLETFERLATPEEPIDDHDLVTGFE
jgi:hypothetical protein